MYEFMYKTQICWPIWIYLYIPSVSLCSNMPGSCFIACTRSATSPEAAAWCANGGSLSLSESSPEITRVVMVTENSI